MCVGGEVGDSTGSDVVLLSLSNLFEIVVPGVLFSVSIYIGYSYHYYLTPIPQSSFLSYSYVSS